MIGRFLYQLSILLLIAGVHIAALFHPKSAKWVKGRRNWRKRLKDELDTKRKSDRPTVWMHASSLGEYEQGRPILEGLQADHPGLNIILSFFSPSGYEVARYHDLATIVCYLPADTPQAARDMVTIIKPDLVLWMKYEYWYNHLKAIDEQRIPVLLVSAIFQSRQPFFKWYGGWYRQMLGYFTHLFVQDNWSVELVKRYVDTDRITQNGDTRFDRVLGIANSWQRIPELETWLAGAEQVAVAGSTWPDDDKVLRHLVNTRGSTRWIIAPHHTEKGPIEA
ncbi:MAG TPA: glycosyltransferase N-terminal domain-containing protein, partial [Phnomibacter sp.]|nr:glycosyltransferase N-terminal domain-containing protein [Phnomibacter sp.]